MITKQFLLTEDGSYTVAIPEMNVTYHNIHGALQESVHIYLQTGFLYVLPFVTHQTISVFEMGFGTGFNALITALEAIKLKRQVYYYTTEAFPLTIQEAQILQQDQLLNTGNLALQLHQASWEQDVVINPNFILHKTKRSLLDLTLPRLFDVVYFDAFAPTIQPELWTEVVFANLYKHINHNGVLVTYSSKGSVRRAMKAVGFEVEKLAGPKGKAEIVRAVKRSA